VDFSIFYVLAFKFTGFGLGLRLKHRIWKKSQIRQESPKPQECNFHKHFRTFDFLHFIRCHLHTFAFSHFILIGFKQGYKKAGLILTKHFLSQYVPQLRDLLTINGSTFNIYFHAHPLLYAISFLYKKHKHYAILVKFRAVKFAVCLKFVYLSRHIQ